MECQHAGDRTGSVRVTLVSRGGDLGHFRVDRIVGESHRVVVVRGRSRTRTGAEQNGQATEVSQYLEAHSNPLLG